MPAKKQVKKNDASNTDETQVNAPNDTVKEVLKLCGIRVEEPKIDTLTTLNACKAAFDDMTQTYVQMSKLLMDIDAERGNVVKYLGRTQKHFKLMNAGLGLADDDEDDNDADDREEKGADPTDHVENPADDDVVVETDDHNNDEATAHEDDDDHLSMNDSDLIADEEVDKPKPVKKKVTKKVVVKQKAVVAPDPAKTKKKEPVAKEPAAAPIAADEPKPKKPKKKN